MISPRVAIATGSAGAAISALVLAGRLEGSIVVVVALALAARAAAAAASPDLPEAQRAFGAQTSLVPAWIGVAIVAAMRAGSGSIADIRGANAVAGLAVARGSVLVVAACWIAVAAGALALIAPSGRGSTAWGLLVTPEPVARLEGLAVVLQTALLITMFAGPQVRGVRDVGPWVVGAVAAAELLWFGRRVAGREWVPRAAVVFSALSVLLMLIAGRS